MMMRVVTDRTEKAAARGHFAAEAGFVVPAVLFALLILSTLALAALSTSRDELLSSQAMARSSSAFYAAEAGLNQIYAEWDSTEQAQLDTLSAGSNLDLGWQTLSNGMSYRGTIYRWDNGDGDAPSYQLVVDGRGVGSRPAQRTLSLALTTTPGSGYKIGMCCEGAATVRGDVDIDDASLISGFDRNPAGWDSAGVCSEDPNDRAGLIMEDTTMLDRQDSESIIEGDPGLMQDPAVGDSAFDYFNGLSWDSLKAMTDFEFGTPGESMSLDEDDIRPSYNADGSCNTTDKYNWGSNDPTDACYNHFPIIKTYGDLNLNGGMYGQAILLPDTATFTAPDGSTVLGGSEIDIEEAGTHFNGVILGKGCVEIQEGAVFHGAIFVNGDYWTGGIDGMGSKLCDPDDPLDVNRGSTAQWSQCAVDRAIASAGLEHFGQAENPGGLQRLSLRAFAELGL